jgi:hypothetical protein
MGGEAEKGLRAVQPSEALRAECLSREPGCWQTHYFTQEGCRGNTKN